jgi:hypothetical protein
MVCKANMFMEIGKSNPGCSLASTNHVHACMGFHHALVGFIFIFFLVLLLL